MFHDMNNIIGIRTLISREVDRFLRIITQSLVAPWLSALLFILVFGKIIGSRIGDIDGIPYIRFVIPGTLMMNVTMTSFMQSSSSLYFQRFLKHIEELLVAPFSYGEMIVGFLVGALARGLVVGLGIYAMALVFGAAQVVHPFWFLFYLVAVCVIFGLLGLIVGLWAEGFEQLALVPTFLITPLSFLGGMFNSLSMIPASFRWVVRLNPMFYLVDGLRYSMTGLAESNRLAGVVAILLVGGGLFLLVRSLFARGWKIRS